MHLDQIVCMCADSVCSPVSDSSYLRVLDDSDRCSRAGCMTAC